MYKSKYLKGIYFLFLYDIMLCEERFMFKKLNLIQCIIVLLMVVFIPFRGFHPILFTIGGWLGTIGILIGFVSIKMLSKMQKNIEYRLKMCNICVNVSLLNSLYVHYTNSTFVQYFSLVMAVLFLILSLWLYNSRTKWESVQEELSK